MKGLIYKENMMFIKSLDKKTLLIIVAAVAAFFVCSGEYAGSLASVLFAMMIGMQNISGIALDEKADWKKYQMAMPASVFTVIEAKYVSVLCTASVSLLVSIVLNLLGGAIFRSFNIFIILASMIIAVIIPLLWAGIGLPLAYWFGYGCSRMIGFICVFPVFYAVRYFEDAGFSIMTDSIISYAIIIVIGTVVIFAASMLISVAGYRRKV